MHQGKKKNFFGVKVNKGEFGMIHSNKESIEIDFSTVDMGVM